MPAWVFTVPGGGGGGGGGNPVEVQDEGITLTSAVEIINFVGKVAATAVGNDVTVTIPGAVFDVIANRPAAADSNNGETFWASDTGVIYISDGSTWQAVTITSASVSDFVEAAQDAVGSILTDTATIDFTYNDGADTITADVVAGSIGPSQLTDTAVTPGSYGSATQVATFTVDADGRLTSASNTTIQSTNSWKQTVRAATTVAGTLATSFENTDVIDGVTLATNDRILIKNQVSGGENGIYTVNASGAPTRSTDCNTAALILQATVAVQEGTVNADAVYMNTTNAPITLGTTATVWSYYPSGTELASLPSASVPIAGTNTVPIIQSGTVGQATVDSIRDIDNWKRAVRVATVTAGTLATSFENGDTVDGVVLATADRILIKDQVTITENGIYTVNASGAPTRATDFDDSVDTLGAAVPVVAGSLNIGTVWRRVPSTTYTFRRFGGQTDVQTFTSSGTYTKPPGAVTVRVMVISAGCGGGSGRRGAAGSIRGGGGGGVGGAFSEVLYKASQVGATETVTISSGGAGGAGVGSDSTNGNVGTAPSATSFGSLLSIANAFSLGGGSAGTSAVGGAGGLAGIAVGNINSNLAGGNGSDGTTAATLPAVTLNAGASGGGGGGVNAANTATAGSGGGSGATGVFAAAAGTGGTVGVAGGAGGNSTVERGGGGGGGGGGSSTVAGGAGGAGGLYGAGGGGGGGGTNGTTGAAGGAGSAGIIIVVSEP